MSPRHRRRSWVLAAAFSMVAVASSCEGSPGRWDGEVVIGIDLEAGQRWSAQGRPVQLGWFCPQGIRHVVEGRDPVTNEVVRVPVLWEIVDGAIEERNTAEVTLVVEHTCADGSGSFVTLERWGPDAWSVESGTGAYGALTGGGTLRFATVHYTEVRPLRLYLEGVLEG